MKSRDRYYNLSPITDTQRTPYDCETVAISWALSLEYEDVDRALGRVSWLGWLQNPIIGNPWNVKRALRKLNVEYEDITVENIRDDDRVIALIHMGKFPGWKHIFCQHWICFRDGVWNWGDGNKFRFGNDILHGLTDCRLYRTILRVRRRDM